MCTLSWLATPNGYEVFFNRDEQRTREILQEALPEISISLSSEICPEVREYERLTTATANAITRMSARARC